MVNDHNERMDQSGGFKYSVGQEDSIHHGATPINIRALDSFHLGLLPIVNIQNEGLDNVITRHNGSFKVHNIFDNKKCYKMHFKGIFLENGYQHKVLYSTKSQ